MRVTPAPLTDTSHRPSDIYLLPDVLCPGSRPGTQAYGRSGLVVPLRGRHPLGVVGSDRNFFGRLYRRRSNRSRPRRDDTPRLRKQMDSGSEGRSLYVQRESHFRGLRLRVQPPGPGTATDVSLDGEHGVGLRGLHEHYECDGGAFGVVVVVIARARGDHVEVVSARDEIFARRVRMGLDACYDTTRGSFFLGGAKKKPFLTDEASHLRNHPKPRECHSLVFCITWAPVAR